jgi:NADH:ubiquinone oxidoreductase subunit D
LVPGVAPPVSYTPRPYTLPEIAGPMREDVQLLPFGPIRADVLESAQFVFYYIGEAVLHYHPQLFFKHRGMEKRFEGLGTDLGAVLAERVSAIGSVAHALAYCRAVESAAECDVPPRAHWLRSLLGELERLYNPSLVIDSGRLAPGAATAGLKRIPRCAAGPIHAVRQNARNKLNPSRSPHHDGALERAARL